MLQINPSLAEKNQHVQYKITYLTGQKQNSIRAQASDTVQSPTEERLPTTHPIILVTK